MTERNTPRFGFYGSALAAALVIWGASTEASAGVLLASDSYATGTDPTMGQYVAGNSLSNVYGGPAQPNNLTNLGFAAGGYNGGSQTSNWISSSTGLVSAADGADSSTGSVEFLGGSGIKNVARNLNLGSGFNEGTTNSGAVYYTSMLVSYSGPSSTTDGFVLAGVGPSTSTSSFIAPTLGTTSGNLFGLYLGFSDDSGTTGETDLVLRSRDAASKTSADTPLIQNAVAGMTYLVVMQIDLRQTSAASPVTYWVDPVDLNSVSDMNSQNDATGTISTYAFQGAITGNSNYDFGRMNYYSSDFNSTANFDEYRLGTSLASIAPAVAVPEPASIAMTALGCGGIAFGSYLRRRRSAR